MSTFSSSSSASGGSASDSVAPAELMAQARALLRRPDPNTKGMWPRSAALLARQALEGAMAQLWEVRAPGMEECSARAQLLSLPSYLGQQHRELAKRAAYAWGGLSRATHHHAYELPPTAAELEGWMETVEEVIGVVKAIASAT